MTPALPGFFLCTPDRAHTNLEVKVLCWPDKGNLQQGATGGTKVILTGGEMKVAQATWTTPSNSARVAKAPSKS